MSRIALPALIVMLAVVSYVGVAQWNASAEPRQVITLTERELPLPQYFTAPGDDPGLQLSIAYENRHDALDARNWLPESRLREIGFALYVPPGGPDAVHTYDRVPVRLAWVVMEYDGPAWRELERRRALRPDERRDPALSSRLVPVDAGPHYEALRARYGEGHIILPAVIGIQYLAPGEGGPLVYGTLRDLAPARVAVPYEFRSLLRAFRDELPVSAQPRYEAELAVGELGLPYLRSVRLRQ